MGRPMVYGRDCPFTFTDGRCLPEAIAFKLLLGLDGNELMWGSFLFVKVPFEGGEFDGI